MFYRVQSAIRDRECRAGASLDISYITALSKFDDAGAPRTR